MPARFHFIGDRTERLFSKAERCVLRWHFEEAVRWFDAAIETDPSYAHLYLYKGVALAEMERYAESLREIDKSIRIDASNFVFPMYVGCINLDEGDVQSAAAAFERAASLAPDNSVIAGYRILTGYLRGANALAQVRPLVDLTPASFQARLLIAMSEGGSNARTVEPQTTSPETRSLLASVRQLAGRMKKWSFDRKARRLFDLNEHESFVELVESGPPAWQAELQARVTEARNHALRKVREEIDRAGIKSGAANGSRWRAKNRAEKRRRALYLRSANLRGIDRSGQAADLTRWIESYRTSGAEGEPNSAAAVLTTLAEIKWEKGQLETAIELCAESRSMGSMPEADWIEAHVQNQNGRKRLARRLFERFGTAEPLTFRRRVLERLHSHG